MHTSTEIPIQKHDRSGNYFYLLPYNPWRVRINSRMSCPRCHVRDAVNFKKNGLVYQFTGYWYSVVHSYLPLEDQPRSFERYRHVQRFLFFLYCTLNGILLRFFLYSSLHQTNWKFYCSSRSFSSLVGWLVIRNANERDFGCGEVDRVKYIS